MQLFSNVEELVVGGLLILMLAWASVICVEAIQTSTIETQAQRVLKGRVMRNEWGQRPHTTDFKCAVTVLKFSEECKHKQ
jgi:hypothetical protein